MPSDEYELTRGIFFEHFRLKPGKPEFELLRGIVSCYSNLPYENVTKIIKKFTVADPIERLRKPKEVVTGFVEMGTGGTCFSLTYALGNILSIFFHVVFHIHVRIHAPIRVYILFPIHTAYHLPPYLNLQNQILLFPPIHYVN